MKYIRHQRVRKKRPWVSSHFIFKTLQQYFKFHSKLTLAQLMFVNFLILLVGSHIPLQCSAIEKKDLNAMPSVVQMNFNDFVEHSKKSKQKESLLQDVESSPNNATDDVSLKQITSVEYSWSEHINIGGGSDNYFRNDAVNEIGFYDVVNEIEDDYADDEDNEIDVELNPTKAATTKVANLNLERNAAFDDIITTDHPLANDIFLQSTPPSMSTDDQKEHPTLPIATSPVSILAAKRPNDTSFTIVNLADASFEGELAFSSGVPPPEVTTRQSTLSTFSMKSDVSARTTKSALEVNETNDFLIKNLFKCKRKLYKEVRNDFDLIPKIHH